MTMFKFVSWNICGIGSQSKQLKETSHLHRIQADICLLQETHLTESRSTVLKSTSFPHIFTANYNSRQRRVATIISNRVAFNHHTSISDPEGRYVIIHISINNTPLTIVNLYGPNNDDPSFFQKIFSILNKLPSSDLIIGGDFTTILDPTIDKSNSTGNIKTPQSTIVIKQYMEDCGLGDGWRLNHPTDKEYTHFSKVHHTYSRTDYFLTSNSLHPIIHNTQIHPNTVSDHATVSFTLHTKRTNSTSTRWRFNTSLLEDKDFDSYFKREWTSFMDMNDSPNTSTSLLWQTGKAVLRGKIISYSSYKKRKDTELENDLEKKIKELENTHATNPSESIYNELLKHKTELSNLLNKKKKISY